MEFFSIDRLCRQWDQIDQLRPQVLSQGFTSAEFADAVESIGVDLQCVTSFFRKYGFVTESLRNADLIGAAPNVPEPVLATFAELRSAA